MRAFDELESLLGVKETENCVICNGVLQHAEQTADNVVSGVVDSGFEYRDFKLSFTISLRAYLQRYLLISKAE